MSRLTVPRHVVREALPETDNRTFIVVDAIIATGNNALRAIEILQEHGVDEKRIRFCVVQATIEGAYKLFVEHPEISIHAGSLGTLVPGTKEVVPRLGDVGDRLFFGPNN